MRTGANGLGILIWILVYRQCAGW